jgi:hypothetical protein
MIHSGLVNQRRGGGFEKGYPNQRNNHPRDQEMRPWVSGFDLPVMEKSQYATPSAPEGSSKVGVVVKPQAQVFYNDIFGKSLSPSAKYYLSQLVKRVARGGGGLGGGGTDGGGGPGGMGGPQRPTGPSIPPPGQVPVPGVPVEAPGQGPGEQMPQLMQESDGEPVDLGDYNVADLDTELQAEVEFEDIFDTTVPHVHEEDVTSAGPTTNGPTRIYPEVASDFHAGSSDRSNSFNAETGSSYKSVFDTAANALSTTGKVAGAVLTHTKILPALLQVLPEKYAGPALALTRKIEDMQTHLGRLAEDYVVVPVARKIAGAVKENVAKAVTRGTKRAYDAATRVAGLAQAQGPATFDTALQQGNIPVDQIEKIIRETFGDLNERGMEAFIQKNIETARMAVSDRLVGEAQLMRAGQAAAASRVSSIAQFFVRLVAFIAFSNFVPRDRAMQIANNYARGAPGSRLRPIAALRPVQRLGFQ